MNFNNFLLIGAGGALGSMLRYFFSLIITTKIFPYSTLIVNILGCLLIGILLGLLLKNSISNYGWKFLATGFCGGFTTFSAFSLEGIELLQQQRYLTFFVYFFITITVGLAATYLGFTFFK